jgi:hypothetical protein
MNYYHTHTNKSAYGSYYTASTVVPDLTSTTNRADSDAFRFTIEMLEEEMERSRANKARSLSEITRSYSGNFWRPYQHPVSSANATRATAVAFGIGAGIEYDRFDPTGSHEVMMTDYPPVTRDRRTNARSWRQPIFLPSNLIECARLLVVTADRADYAATASAIRILDEALDATTGFGLLVGSTRPTLWAGKSEHSGYRVGFGHTLPHPYEGLDGRGWTPERLRAAFQVARNDLAIRARANPAQRLLAQKARRLLLRQFAYEAAQQGVELTPICRAIRVAMIAQHEEGWNLVPGCYGTDTIGVALFDYHQISAAKDGDGTYAYNLFAQLIKGVDDFADPNRFDNRSIEYAREYEDRTSRVADQERESAVRVGKCVNDQTKSITDDEVTITMPRSDSMTGLAESVTNHLDTMNGSHVPSAGEEQPDPRTVSEIVCDFTTATITTK